MNENNTFTNYDDLKIKALKSKFDFDLLNIDKYFNPTFILSCYEVFFRMSYINLVLNKSDTINIINSSEENFFIEAFKNLGKFDNLSFIFEKDNNDNYNFKFSYNKDNKEIFYLKGICQDNYLFTIEEFFKFPDTKPLFIETSSLNFSSFNDKLLKNELEDFKIISKYNNNTIINKIPLSKTIKTKEINYLLEDNLDKNLFNRYYFYNDDLVVESIMYLLLRDEYVIRFYYDLDKKIYVLLRDEYAIRFYYDLDKKIYKRTAKIPDIKDGVKNLSDICIDYLKRTNKKAEDINEDDLNVISMINY